MTQLVCFSFAKLRVLAFLQDLLGQDLLRFQNPKPKPSGLVYSSSLLGTNSCSRGMYETAPLQTYVLCCGFGAASLQVGDPCDVSVPPTVDHGTLDCGTGTNIPSGSSCTVRCDPYFTPSKSTVTCTAGTLQAASCAPGEW